MGLIDECVGRGDRLRGASAAEAVSRMDGFAERIRKEPRLAGLTVTRPHPLLVLAARDHTFVLFAPGAVWDRGADLVRPFAARLAEGAGMMVALGRPEHFEVLDGMHLGLATILPSCPEPDELALAALRAFELIDARARAENRGKWVRRYRYELGELVHIARAMTTERDVNRLLGVILEKSRFITGADAGSVYVVEESGTANDPEGARHSTGLPRPLMLRFKLSQNESVAYDSSEFVMPLSNRSIAGSAAIAKRSINIADAYEIDAGAPYAFDRRFDEKIGYRTKSMLTVPLVSQRDEVIGVIQLINKKRDPKRRLVTHKDIHEQVVAFDDRSEELLGLLAAQAGASLESAMLYEEIQRLFDGFVHASVEAIEQRDPTTSGHSRRVSDLTLELAKVVDGVSSGPYRDAKFSREDLRELEYASLLHDFGKIGVREKVLVKARKLYDEKLVELRLRFDFVSRSIEADVLRRKLAALERGSPRAALDALDAEAATRQAELHDAWATVVAANEPTVLAAGDFAKIEKLARETYYDARGEVRPLLERGEALALSVTRGSLTPKEYEEITSHVSHTYHFLSQIPWGKAFRRVPQIAGAHHERLDGTGYPHRLRADEIPLQSKLMSVGDIFDALTASDRPYKRAVPIERALDILDLSVRDQHIDPELVRLFREARVWQRAEKG